MTADESMSPVYDTLMPNCEPYAIEGPLSFLPAAPGAYSNPRDPVTTVAHLTADHSAEALLAAGVVVRDSDGTLSLAPVLADPTGILIALRDPESGRISDVLTDVGCLSGRELPIFAALNDGPTRTAADTRDGELLVAFLLRDVAVLRACGLAATLAVGMENLAPRQGKQLAENFGLTLRSSSRRREEKFDSRPPMADPSQPTVSVHPLGGVDGLSVTPAPVTNSDQHEEEVEDETGWKITFVGWSPAALASEPPALLKAIIQHFGRLDEFLGLDTLDLSAWVPTQKELNRLSFFAEHRDADHFREGLRDSLYESTCRLMDVGKPRPQTMMAPQDVATAYARLCHPAASSAAGRPSAEERQRAWNAWLRLLDEQVIRPLRDDALLASEPRERMLRSALAEVSHAFHLRAAELNQKLSRTTAERSAENSEPMALKSYDKLLATVDRIVDLSQEIDRCEQTAQIRTIPASVVPVKRLGGSPGSG